MKLIKKKTIKLFLAIFIVSYFASARWKNRSIQCEGIVGYLEQSHHQWVNSAPFYLPVAHIQRYMGLKPDVNDGMERMGGQG